MLSKNIKRLILFCVSLFVSLLIWHVNRNIFGNRFLICFILSATTFLIIYTPFEIYWSFRDLYFDRWEHINTQDLEIENIKIVVGRNKKAQLLTLSAALVSLKKYRKTSNGNKIVIVAHGFSDTKENLQYYYFPLALHGYTILAYDARGTGESKKVGKRSQFIQRIEDYKVILNWIKNHDIYGKMDIYTVGFSIGALTVLIGSFEDQDVKKIIAISSISNYRQNLPKFNPIILLSYYLKGVKLYPKEEENKRLSRSCQ